MPKVVVAGVSGVVGFAAAHRFAASGWDVVGLSRRRPDRLTSSGTGTIRHVPVDLADPASVEAARPEFDGATHLVFAALYEKPGLIPGWRERDQMETNLAMLANLFDRLDHRTLRHVSVLQGTKAYGAHVEPMAVPGRERNPRHDHENFYWLQEDFLRERQADTARGERWTMTIVRPQVIYGEALGGNMNALPALGVYAAILRADGEPLHYPGGVAPVSEAVDADLVGRFLLWAAENAEPGAAAADETFNVTNGDVYTLRNCWPVIADAFGMEVGDDRPLRLAESMPTREQDWARLVADHDLVAPTSLETFVGQSFIYADLISGYGQDRLRSPSLVSTIKARQAGFVDCEDTEDMFRRLIKRFQEARLFPAHH